MPVGDEDEGMGSIAGYRAALGVPDRPPLTSPFDPGYDPATVESHLEQSAHLMASLKISMTCWLIASEAGTRRKLGAARSAGVPTVAGGGPFEIAADRDRLDAYFDLCGELGFARLECAHGFTDIVLDPSSICDRAGQRGLQTQFEVGGKHSGAFDDRALEDAVSESRAWLDAGATAIVVEAREDAVQAGLF